MNNNNIKKLINEKQTIINELNYKINDYNKEINDLYIELQKKNCLLLFHKSLTISLKDDIVTI